MAGRITISTLNNDTGVLATQNGMNGICKAWVNFTGSSASINGSFNVSSITRQGTGQYIVNFTTAMSNANYAVNVNTWQSVSQQNQGLNINTLATTSFYMNTLEGGTLTDPTRAYVTVQGI